MASAQSADALLFWMEKYLSLGDITLEGKPLKGNIPGKLILQDGTEFTGRLLHDGKAAGEVVFNTGMTGYQEILTDPSYCDQIVTLTYPLVGNYGTARISCSPASPLSMALLLGSCAGRVPAAT